MSQDQATALVLRAAAFAAHKHREQKRKDLAGTPYIGHPLAVADILANEAGVTDATTLVAALLHDTVEDTDTSLLEIKQQFGREVADVVAEVTDDKSLPKPERKALQVTRAPGKSARAKLVKLADKTSNLRDIAATPPTDWSHERKVEYFRFAKAVADGLRGNSPKLEQLFDEAHAHGLASMSPA